MGEYVCLLVLWEHSFSSLEDWECSCMEWSRDPDFEPLAGRAGGRGRYRDHPE